MYHSVDSSGLSSLEQEETSTLVATEWTNEKHGLFIKFMESAFVEQLYKSLDLSCWHKSKSSKHKLNCIRDSSAQFKVLHEGSWSILRFRGDEPEVGEQVESASPWIHHYRNSKIQSIRKFPVSTKPPLTDTENQNRAHNFQLRHHDYVGSHTERTGQNFADEALEKEKSRSTHDTKSLITKTHIDSSNDRVVPYSNSIEDHNFSDHMLPEE